MANKYIFNSPFKSDIQKFLDLKHSLGYKYALEEILLSQFDKMCIFKYPKEKVLTRIIAMDWATARKNESNSSLGNRIVTLFILYFLEYCIVVDYEFQKHYILKLKMWIYKMALFMFMNLKTILID